MQSNEKFILEMFCKYAEMVNEHLLQMDHRLRIVEVVMREHPDVFQTYKNTSRDLPRRPSVVGLSRQLQAIAQEVQNL